MKPKNYAAAAVFIVFVLSFTVMFFAFPKAETSEKEKRELQKFPQYTLKTDMDGTYREDLESYVNDHFPMRDFFVGLHSYVQLAMGQNGISGIYKCEGDYLVPTPVNFNREQTLKNLAFFKQLSEETNLKSHLMIVPEAGYIMQDKLPENHGSFDDDAFFEFVKQNAGSLNLIDLRDDFMNADGELYYRTDHHLNSFGSYLMYRTFCNAVDVSPKDFSCAQTYDGFYGTGYSKSGLWFTPPDELEVWLPEDQSKLTVTIAENVGPAGSGKSETFDSVYFYKHLDEMDKYQVFLGGNHSVVDIENEGCKNGKRLLVIKDSYANCFSTFAAESYQHITIVDPRYYKGFITELIEERESNEILYLFGAENLSSSTQISILALRSDMVE